MTDFPARLSVIVPNRNGREFLPERFASLDAQTFRDFEVIVVDGESNDGAWEFLQERAAADPRIRLFRQPPRGPYAAWNLGVREARGDLVHIATSDDSMAPDFLAETVRALDAHPGCGVAHGRLQIIDAKGDPIAAPNRWEDQPVPRYYFREWMDRPHIRPAPHDGMLHAAAGTVYTSINQLVIRREALERIGSFREDLGPGADFEWGMRAGLLCDVVHVPGALAWWRRHETQLTRDADTGASQVRRQMAGMIRSALAAARAVDPSLAALSLRRLTRPFRHDARIAEREKSGGSPARIAWQWLAEPDLIGIALFCRRAANGHVHEGHIAYIRREIARHGVPLLRDL